jgi:hypothetical protein
VEDDGIQRDTADGKATTVWQRTSNYVWWHRGNKGADNNDNKTTINKCAAAEAVDKDYGQEAGHNGGGGMATVMWRWRRSSNAIRSWRMEAEGRWGCIGFFVSWWG